jgi:hypothetical protein
MTEKLFSRRVIGYSFEEIEYARHERSAVESVRDVGIAKIRDPSESATDSS